MINPQERLAVIRMPWLIPAAKDLPTVWNGTPRPILIAFLLAAERMVRLKNSVVYNVFMCQ
jgi:hypothetical protein